MSGIGVQLKQARESMGLTLNDVQRMTKIHLEYLQALEQDQFELLPSPFYVRAFLRSYAHSLGLDAEPFLDRYDKMDSGQPETGPQRESSQAPRAATGRERGGRADTPPQRSRTSSQETKRMRRPQQPLQDTTQSLSRSQRHPVVQDTTRLKAQQPVDNPAGVTNSGKRNTVSIEQTKVAGKAPLSRSTGRHVPVTDNGKGPLSSERSSTVSAMMNVKKPKLSKGVWAGIVAAALLIPATIFGVSQLGGDEESAKKEQVVAADSQTKAAKSDSTGTASAEKVAEKGLVQKEYGDSDAEGVLYELKGESEIVVSIRMEGTEDVSVRFGDNVNETDENFSLETGKKRELKKDDFIWFRVTKPSDTKIEVNGHEIDTTADDLPKSYRIKLVKK
ncbi:RodZ family helix-turn-helix domain-containing protein [Mechercharimyces sp. CAU 1602]|uniref:helix-turn-helix domain-containing protein n=1 Tax=Mechercharimyces sp. CAU 1602 TaxID=2973933 RepID=UPI0021622B19|nr:helix-turn-helix transcriptional regulator [Mechercharimyces sp. CAU 1602]MCS1351240.1 helix-turn-helix domain-containing protein [Mechercharimyces sp. CAU 1602]